MKRARDQRMQAALVYGRTTWKCTQQTIQKYGERERERERRDIEITAHGKRSYSNVIDKHNYRLTWFQIIKIKLIKHNMKVKTL